MRNNCDRVKRVLNKDINILITGETGTGKEEFARTIHNFSTFSDSPFIYLNCSGLTEPELFTELTRSFAAYKQSECENDWSPDALFETGFGNVQETEQFSCTLFLDQISDLSSVLQQDLLHILQTGQITVPDTANKIDIDWQIISADSHTLHDIVDLSMLRPELYYRLNGINVKLPAIRDREDKDELISDILRLETAHVRAPQLSKRASQMLLDYHWPGNFRELKTVLKTAAAMSDGRLIQLSHLPDLRTHRYDQSGFGPDTKQTIDDSSPSPATGPELAPVEMAERDAIVDALEECHWNMSKATSVLKMSRSTLYRKIKKYEIELS